MTLTERHIRQQHRETRFDFVLVHDAEATEPRPTVLVFHGMEGRSDDQVGFARSVAEWGYQALAVDLFGSHEGGATDVERGEQLMAEFLADRGALRERLLDAVALARSLPEVNGERLAALGFCFGGLCVLDLARAGADLRAVASFHGVLTPPPEDVPEIPITARILVFHGWDDPFAPPQDVLALGDELTRLATDWQLHAYGATAHAFMAPWANDPDAGIRYAPRSAHRAWSSLRPFLTEAFA